MNKESSKFKALTAAFSMLMCSFLVLDGYFGTTVGRVILNGKFPVDSYVDVSITNRFGSVDTHRMQFNSGDKNALVRVGTPVINAPLDNISLEFSAPVNVIASADDIADVHLFNVHGMEITQPLGSNTVISQKWFREHFTSDDFFSDSSNVLRADSITGKAKLNLSKPIGSDNKLRFSFISLFLALLTWLMFRYSSVRHVPAFSDMNLGRKISSKAEFDTVNGLRGIAALLVLFSHAAPGFFSVNVGIAILFVISGFLLSRPFVENSARIYSWRNIEIYLAKRVKRILPMYYFFIAITYVATSQFDTAMRNFLFVEASGHLWPMIQIFTFYICLPLILLATSTLSKLHNLLPIVVLLVAASLWEAFMSNWKPFYNGRYFTQFHLFAFLIGVAGSYINYGCLNINKTWRLFVNRWLHLLSLVLLVLTSLTIAWSAPIDPPLYVQLLISQFYVKCILSVVIVIVALQVSGAAMMRILSNWLFRSVGVIGFSFYLWHGLGIELALNLQSTVFGVAEPSERSWSLTAIAFCITYIMAVFTYSYIERPFFGYQPDSEKN